MSGCIVGWAHGRFGRHESGSLEALIAETGAAAIRDAGLEPEDVGEIMVGNFGGFEKQSFPASFALAIDPALRFRPATRVENACATGSAALHQGLNAVAAGRARFVLVIGAERMTAAPGAEIGDILLNASYRAEEGGTEGGFAGIFGRIAELYFQRYGDRSEALARIAAKNHGNGVANPYAQLRKDLGFAFCNAVSDKNPLVAGPLRRTDCSLVSDGAAAIVLTDTETALRMPKAVHLRAAVQVNDYLPMSRRDVVAFEGCAEAWRRAHDAAGTVLADLDLVETHDCFTIAELIEYEAMGLTRPGEGHRAIDEGWVERDGRLPVNPSGGLKAKGHPIGATGVSMHALAAMQLTGTAEGMQVPGAALAGIFNMGGTAVANYVSILERLR
ncbi:acetyl-CoA acetyltransferase [Propylenella binzhouense]|uniref:Thiolase domain-containing protein n=1 Tax=Propylenella binzhouense TaxID=2555902 RepID=A0A964T7L2_9HYPH|nr:acetyl-CoA acetyltransferase [Propylenella binzhouense]MYZ49978.1 thiolase domain-containing protein [Propylenella binzhouense]